MKSNTKKLNYYQFLCSRVGDFWGLTIQHSFVYDYLTSFFEGPIKVQLALDDDALKALGGGGAAPAAEGGGGAKGGEMGTMQALALGALLAGGGGKGGGGGGDDGGGGKGGKGKLLDYISRHYIFFSFILSFFKKMLSLRSSYKFISKHCFNI